LNAFFTNIVLSRKVLAPLVQFGMFYMFTNFVQTKRSGKPIYYFLTWEDYRSPTLVVIMLLGFSMIYIGLCKIDEYLKWDDFVARNLKYLSNGPKPKKSNKVRTTHR